jgi:NAD(P)-dependent dehydrogenase (short-subunit alcohol dehydrogenase family)
MSRTVLVTGAGSGIGRATAQAFANDGARVVVCDVNPDKLGETARSLGSALLLSEPVDVSNETAMRAFSDKVHAAIPAIDVLVNNAGVALAGGIDTSLEDWRWVMGVNLWGVIHGCHFFVPPMRDRGRGHVVNVSSIFGVVAPPDVLGYSTTKFGVFGLSESLRGELAPHGIHVTTVCPGMIATNIIHSGRFAGTTGDRRDKTASTFAKRGARPEKVAAAIVDAVKRPKSVITVAAEAHFLYFLKRFAPRLTQRITQLLHDKI